MENQARMVLTVMVIFPLHFTLFSLTSFQSAQLLIFPFGTELRIHDEIERGDNDTIKQAGKGTTNSGQKCCSS